MKPYIALCALGFFSSLLSAGEPTLTAEERAKMIKLLRESQAQFLELVRDVGEAGWNYKPGPDRWSVAEVAEHILLTEGSLFGRAEQALAAPPNPDWESKTAGKTEFIERVMPDRSRKAQAPESVQPRSGLSRAEVLRRFQEARARTIAFVEKIDRPVKAHTAEHPFPVFGTLNAHQWLIYIPLHNSRHNQQIEEVKASAGFPR